MSTTKFTSGGTQSKTFEELLWTPSLQVDYIKDLLFSQQCTFSSPSQHSLQILSSLLPFTRYLPSTRCTNSITILWQQLSCWLVLLPSLTMLPIGCPRFRNNEAFVVTHLTQPTSRALHCFFASLMTMTAISVHRLLAMLLGLRYKQIVTLKRTYIIVATIWVLSLASSWCTPLDHRLTLPLCLGISLASYTKIFRTLRYHQAQAEDPVQQQPKCTEHSSIQKSSVWCTVGEVSISCLFCTILYRGNRDCT